MQAKKACNLSRYTERRRNHRKRGVTKSMRISDRLSSGGHRVHDTVCKWNQETTDHTDNTDGNMQRGFFPIRVIRAIRGEFSAKRVLPVERELQTDQHGGQKGGKERVETRFPTATPNLQASGRARG